MTHRIPRRGALGAAALSAALLVTACAQPGTGPEDEGADGGDLTNVRLQLQWLPQGQFAGYFAAQDQGYFAEEGLDVELVESGGDIVPQDALANGDADYAIAWVPKVLSSIEGGAHLTHVAQIF